MSDFVRGDGWWKASDGHWYPPEEWTGAPEDGPGEQRGADPRPDPDPETLPRGASPLSDSANPANSTPPEQGSKNDRGWGKVVVVALIVMVLALGVAAGFVAGRSGPSSSTPSSTEAPTTVASTTTPTTVVMRGVVSSGAYLDNTVLNGTESCSAFGSLPVQVADGSGEVLAVATLESPTESDRTADGAQSSWTCETRYKATVPARPVYQVTLVDPSNANEPIASGTVNRSDRELVRGPYLRAAFVCVVLLEECGWKAV